MSGRQKLWINAEIYTPQGVLKQGRMLVGADGKIEAVGGQEVQADDGVPIHDAKGLKIIPGLIDVHVHGGNGFSFMDGTEESLEEMSKFHAMHGTTSFLATTSTASDDKLVKALQCAVSVSRTGLSGAEMLGVHFEGPFINAKRRGAQSLQDIRLPNVSAMERYWKASEGLIRLITLAPEVEGGMEAVKWFAGLGVTVSIGHSDATYEQVVQAVELGASHTTHHFNGMSPLHHREPGVAGAGLMLPELTTELIVDGIHVHPSVVKLLFETKGPHKVCMITDAVFCAGLPDGEYESVYVTNGEVYLKDGSSLAGSSLTTIRALRNVIRYTGLPLEKVLPSMTEVPAKEIKVYDRKGSLDPGKDADFLLVDDQLEIHATYVAGKEVYRRMN